MKTDSTVYEFLATGAEAFRILTNGIVLPGPYRFGSLTYKAVERRIDGVLEPEGHDGPVYIIEFQGQYLESIWFNLLTKVGLYGERHPGRAVRAVLIFLRSELDPHTPGWSAFANRNPALTVVYLDTFLPEWLQREPGNPYLAVLAPLVLDSDEELRQQAPRLWLTISEAEMPGHVRQGLEQVLLFWLAERFSTLSKKEILSMLQSLTPLHETRVYKEIFAEGEVAGEARGEVRGEAKLLKRMLAYRFGTLPDWAVRRIDAAEPAQIEQWSEGIFDAVSIQGLLGTE